MVAEAVPVSLNAMKLAPGAAAQVADVSPVEVVAADASKKVCVPDTCAVLVNDPNRPNTKPAMAMAAMSVMAMRMTVASTGEMAFLFLFLLILMAIFYPPLYWNAPVNWTCAPLDIDREPTNCSPDVETVAQVPAVKVSVLLLPAVTWPLTGA